ncbi:putative reverse transcriptase domain-containing protein [Tanacetum coccineum]
MRPNLGVLQIGIKSQGYRAPAEEQPLPAAVSPTADLPGYIPESDLEEDPEEDDDEDPEEDPADYPTDRDEEEEPSKDEADDEDEDDEEEEEDHPAPADSVPPPPVHHTTARISIPAQAPVPFLSEDEVERFLAISTPPPSPLTPLSSPLPQIPSPPLPASPPLLVSSPPLPASPIHPLGYRAAMIWLRAKTPSTSYPLPSSTPPSGTPPLLPIPLPTSSPPLILPSTDYRANVSEIRRDPERDVGYGITDTWDEMLVGMPGAPAIDDIELGRLMTNFVTTNRQDTDEIYGRLDEAQDARVVLSGRVSGEAWGRSMDASDTARSEVRSLRTTMLAQQTEIAALRAVDRARQKNEWHDSHNSGTGVRRQTPPTYECTYPDFMECKPLYFKGTEGVVELTQCALTWWNSHVKTVGHDVAYAMTWTKLKKKMTDKYCPMGEIKKLEAKMWNLMVKELDKIEKYVGGLPDMIYRSVMASKPKTMQDAIEFATELMDKKIRAFAERQSENKRKQDDNQQQNKRQNTGRAYVTGSGVLQMPTLLTTKGALRQVRKLLDMNVEPRDISRGIGQTKTQTSLRIDITPSTLDHYYDVELANERIIGLNAIIQGCTLNYLNHPFNIDLMPVELGSLNVIIGMDWLAKYQAVIICAEKIICIPWGNETLIVRGDESDQGNETRLNIISFTKTQKHMLKGCPIFLAHVTTKETEDKSEKKRLEDVPIVQNFPEVFPEDLPGLPPTRQVEFQIDLITGDAPVAHAPYQLASSEMKELSDQLKELSDKGFIRPSSSPWGAPILFVKKKDVSF